MISIIIPCYNSEKYIIKNLKSLINQANKRFKVCFIDDGSTDNTVNIIEENLKGTSVNYEIYKRDHEGVGAARNFGISLATTPYIMFLDSDDYLKENCIEIFLKEIQKNSSDIIIAEYEHEYKNKIVWTYSQNYMKLNSYMSNNEVLNMILDNKIHVCTSNAIYKKDLFYEKFFHNTCMYHEDLNMWYRLINTSKSIKFIEDVVFVYVIRDSSISHDLSIEKLQQGIYMLEELYNEFKKNGVKNEILEKIKYKTIPNICYLFFNALCLENKEVMRIYKGNRYFEIMRKSRLENSSIKALIKYCRILFIGYLPNLYRFLWNIYKKYIKPLLLSRR